jgi:hypothetical protein
MAAAVAAAAAYALRLRVCSSGGWQQDLVRLEPMPAAPVSAAAHCYCAQLTAGCTGVGGSDCWALPLQWGMGGSRTVAGEDVASTGQQWAWLLGYEQDGILLAWDGIAWGSCASTVHSNGVCSMCCPASMQGCVARHSGSLAAVSFATACRGDGGCRGRGASSAVGSAAAANVAAVTAWHAGVVGMEGPHATLFVRIQPALHDVYCYGSSWLLCCDILHAWWGG